MGDHSIPNENINASTVYREYYPWKGRLNWENHYWIPDSRDKYDSNQWIQADIGYRTNVFGVITQGGGDGNQNWVTSIKVSTFLASTSDEEIFIKDEDENQKVSKHIPKRLGLKAVCKTERDEGRKEISGFIALNWINRILCFTLLILVILLPQFSSLIHTSRA